MSCFPTYDCDFLYIVGCYGLEMKLYSHSKKKSIGVRRFRILGGGGGGKV